MLTKDVSPSLFTKISHSLKKAKINAGFWFINKMEISKQELDPVPTFFNKVGNLLLKPFVNKDLVAQLLMGPYSFQLFKVGHDIGLYDYLNDHPGSSKNELAAALKLEHYPLDILLLGLSGLKVLKKVGDQYYTSAATRIVTQDKTNKFTQFFPKYLQYAQHLLIPGTLQLEQSIKHNQPLGLKQLFGERAADYYYELSKDQTANQYFAEHMAAFSQINAERLASLPIFNKINTLLDVGGGIGAVALSIATRNPQIKITVYDHPEVAKIANQKFTERNMTSQLHAIGADVATNAFPNNYDGVLFSHFIDIFSPDKNKEFFQRAYECLNPNGHIVIYTPVVNDNENGPLVNCVLGVYFLCLANGEGRFYSCAQLSNWLHEAGFSNIRTMRLPSSEAIITAKKY